MKNLLIAGALCLTLGFTSCLKESTSEYNQTVSTSVINLITSLDDGTTTPTLGTYSVTLEYNSRLGSVSTEDLIINNASYKFTSNDITFKTPSNNEIYLENFTGNVNGNYTMDLNEADFLLISPYSPNGNGQNSTGYYYNTDYIGNDYTFYINPISPGISIAKYNIGDLYTVNTIPVNTFFKGNTHTTYPGQGGVINEADVEGITYRLILYVKDMKATVIMYNAKFSAVPQEPTKAAILIEGLDWNFTQGKLTVTGSEITPSIYEADEFTPNDRFIINSLTLQTTNEYLTECVIDFEVAGIYTGQFSGAYIDSFYMVSE